MSEKSDFFTEYDALVSDVSRAFHQQFSAEIARWLNLLAENAQTKTITDGLGQNPNKEDWARTYCSPSKGMGGGSVNWPSQKEQRLGAQFDLLRLFARNEWDAFQFSMNYLRTGSTNINDIVQTFVQQVFQPTARDLRRYIDLHWRVSPDVTVPASDRVVRLDHNLATYRNVIDALTEIRKAVAETNDYPNAEDKEQRIAELDASKVILGAKRVSLGALRALTIRCLQYLADKFAESVIATLVSAAIVALVALFGIHLFQ